MPHGPESIIWQVERSSWSLAPADFGAFELLVVLFHHRSAWGVKTLVACKRGMKEME
ncbi:hypothetical protein [Amycolatopsis sp. NBC_01286]|uniref:hypothetical protein n=1 Tax=Amycolatopsis sp. NBC_01286 TaxID=2903560 RepID=UPI002E156354|nr:hypothetical protein OG570_16890 [Amycolatopsis sp. NBC_01286]